MHRWIQKTMGAIFGGFLGIGMMASASAAPIQVGVEFAAASINEGDSAVLNLKLSETVGSDYTFYLRLTAAENAASQTPTPILPSVYFPDVSEMMEVKVGSQTNQVQIPLQSLGRIGSQSLRTLRAEILTAMLPNGFEVNPTTDSTIVKLNDGTTLIGLEVSQLSVPEGDSVLIRAVLSGAVSFNRSADEVSFDVPVILGGEGWPATLSEVTLKVPANASFSPWAAIQTKVSDGPETRTATLKVKDYLDQTLKADPNAVAVFIREKMTASPICTFNPATLVVSEPINGDTTVVFTLSSINGTPLAGTRIPFRLSGSAVEKEQYSLESEPFFLFDGQRGTASVKLKIHHDGIPTPNRDLVISIYSADQNLSFGSNPKATLTIVNTDPVTDLPAGMGGFIGNAALATDESTPLPLMIAINGLPQGAVGNAVFTVSGGKNGVDYTIRGASNISGKKWVVTTQPNGIGTFTLHPINNFDANEKPLKLTLKISSIKSASVKKNFKLQNKKTVITINDDDPLINPVHLVMPHAGAKRYASYDLAGSAAKAAGFAEDTALLSVDMSLTDSYTFYGAAVVLTGNKTILYNTNTPEFRKRVSDAQFKLGLTDHFSCAIAKAGGGTTKTEVSVCIGDLYTRGSIIQIPFGIVNAATDSLIAATSFTHNPQVSGLYYDPAQKIKGSKAQKPKKVMLKSQMPADLNTSVFAEFTRKLFLENKKALRESQKNGKYFAEAESSVQAAPIGVEIRVKTTEMMVTGKKGKIDVTAAGMILAPPQVDSVSFFTDFKTKSTVMKVVAKRTGTKGKFSLEYRDNNGKIKHLFLKSIRVTPEKPVTLISLNGESNEFIANLPPVYANGVAVYYFALPAEKKLPSAYNNRFDLFVESEIGAASAVGIGFPWKPYVYLRSDIRFTARTIAGIPALECIRDDGYQAKPLVFLNHGFMQSKNDPAIMKSAESLAEAGFFVVLTDAVGHGERLNPTGLLPTEIPMVWADELAQVVRTYQNDPRVDYARIGMTGFSMGGVTTYAFLVRHKGVVKTAVPMIGTPDLSTLLSVTEWQVCQYRSGDIRPATHDQLIRAQQDVQLNNPMFFWKNMIGNNLFMLNGAIDPLIPSSGPSVLHSNLRQPSEGLGNGLSLNFVNGVGHSVTPEMTDLRDQWFIRYLK